MFKIDIITLLIFFVTLSHIHSYAQSITETERQEQLQRNIQERIESEQRRQEMEKILKAPAPTLREDPPKTPPESAHSACIDIKKVEYKGDETVSKGAIDVVIKPYLNRCATTQDINAILRDLTNLYLGKGYITSRAYIKMPQEKLKDGTLELLIVEGKVSAVTGLRKSEIFTAFPDMAGDILYLRDIEQGLDQLNRLESNNVTVDIKPTLNRDSYSDIVLDNQKQGSTAATLFFDNAGSESTGEWRWGAKLSQDNLLNINDQIDISFTKAFNGNYRHNDSSTALASLSVPFRYLTFTDTFSYSGYTTSYLLELSKERFYTLGISAANTFSVDYLYSRGQKYKLSAAAGYIYKRSGNWMKILDTKIKNNLTSRALSVYYVELPSLLYLPSGVLYLKPAYHQGIRLFGSLDDRKYSFEQKAQYTAWKAYAYILYALGFTSLSISADGQYSADILYGSESFFIGGEGSVRGFKNDSALGDKGVAANAELSVNLGRLTNKEILEPYKVSAFYDGGYVESNSPTISAVTLTGTGLALSANYKYWDFKAAYAWALSKPDSFMETGSLYLKTDFKYRF